MKVKLVPIDAEKELDKLYTACRTCYNAGSPIDMFDELQDTKDPEKQVKLLKQVLSSGHFSVIEHCLVTFYIEGVSRSLTHQLVRHRIASYSQQSQRYVEFKGGNFDIICPKTIEKNEAAKLIFDNCMEQISRAYSALTELGIAAEDARAVLPNACASNISVSMNLRSLIHFCNERLCSCAQGEIHQLAREMAKLVAEAFPFMKEFLVPKCEALGYCNEPARRSCGRKILKADLMSAPGKLKLAETRLSEARAELSWDKFPESMGS